MSDDLVKQALEELQDLVRCQCHEAYKGRGLHDPNCCCDYAEALKVVSDRIEELEAKLAKAVSALELIAQPKVGPDFDWSHDEVNRWRDRWYRKYQNIARSTLAELKGGKDE